MISSQLIPIVNDSAANEKYWLAFTAVVPPLGFSTYVITSAKSSAPIKPITYTFGGTRNDSIQIGSGNLKLIYSGNDGKLTQYINSKSSVNVSVEQAYSYYAGHDGNNGSTQASGAYIFRPNATFKIQPEGKIPLTVFKGPLFDEIHQNISSWIYQITRVYKEEKEHVEFEFIVSQFFFFYITICYVVRVFNYNIVSSKERKK